MDKSIISNVVNDIIEDLSIESPETIQKIHEIAIGVFYDFMRPFKVIFIIFTIMFIIMFIITIFNLCIIMSKEPRFNPKLNPPI
jgi:hypothetical protein